MTRTHGRASRWALTAMVVATPMVIDAVGTGAAPASAHSAGKAVVLVRSLTLAPMGTAWHATITIADFDSGAPLLGTSVSAVTAPNQTPTVFQPTSVSGEYQAMLPGVRPGPVQLELRVRTTPGSTPVQPYDKSFPITLVAGQANRVISSGDGSGGGGNAIVPIVAGGGGVLLVGGLLYGLFVRRRRTPVPAAG